MAEEYSESPRDRGQYWRREIDHALDSQKDWTARADRVVERYRDDRKTVNKDSSKFNILWANTEILTPSLYGRPAKPQVSRRHLDSDPVGRLASMMLERTLSYEIEQFPSFDCAMQSVVEDRLLPGRGTIWIRANTENIGTSVDEEYSPVDYVYWKDFLHSPARTWEEVTWVARRVYMTYAEGVRRFGKAKFDLVTLEHVQEDESKTKSKEDNTEKKAKIYEIWSRKTKTVCWIADGYDQLLDERDDPLQVEGFFPCPKPLFATTTNGSLVPIPDYCEYQDQAAEVDDLTGRIDELVGAVRVAGVFNGEFKELARLFQTKGNKLIPVASWAAFSEKQGLKGAIDIIDLGPVAQALGILYNAREAAKQTIYEICGISDILRGSTKAEETLGAQQLKANFGSLRLRASQVDVARFATDILRLKAQLICRLYPKDLIIQMSGIAETEDGKDPRLVEAAYRVLANSTIRDFHITVESDSLAQIDETEEKQQATELITAIGAFMSNGLEAVQAAPELLPFAGETMLATIRRYKGGRELEAAAERSIRMLGQRLLQQAQNPRPSPEEIQAQTQMQSDQLRAQVDTQAAQQKAQFDAQVQQSKLAAEAQLEQMKAQLEMQKTAQENQLKAAALALEDDYKRWADSLKAETAIAVAQIGAASKAQSAEKQLEGTKIKKGPPTDPQIPAILEKVEGLIAESKKPRNKRVVRENGRIVGIETVDGPVQ